MIEHRYGYWQLLLGAVVGPTGRVVIMAYPAPSLAPPGQMMRPWEQAIMLQQVAPKGTAEGQGLARGWEDFLEEVTF